MMSKALYKQDIIYRLDFSFIVLLIRNILLVINYRLIKLGIEIISILIYFEGISMKDIIRILSIGFLWILLIANVVHAATAITYNGQGIRGQYSIQTWYTNRRRTYTVNHNQPPRPGSGNVGFRVSVVSRSWIGGKIYASSVYYGKISGTISVDLNSGTYGLYFNTEDKGLYNISGSVTY